MKDLGRLKRWAKWRYVSFYICLSFALAGLAGASYYLSGIEETEKPVAFGVAGAVIVVVLLFLGVDMHMCTVLSYAAIDLEQTLNEIALYKQKTVEKY